MSVSLAATVQRWLPTDDEDVIYECRQCGTTLDSTDRQCDVCGATDIEEFDIA